MDDAKISTITVLGTFLTEALHVCDNKADLYTFACYILLFDTLHDVESVVTRTLLCFLLCCDWFKIRLHILNWNKM